MRHFKILFGFLLILIMLSNAQAQLQKFQARVKLIITADKNIKGEVTSYLTRELRSLRDVNIVEENADWVVSVITSETKLKGGYKVGVVFSTVILKPFNNDSFKRLLDLERNRVRLANMQLA